MNNSLNPIFGSRKYYRLVLSGMHPPALFANADELVETHLMNDQHNNILDYNRPSEWNFKSQEEILHFKETEYPELNKSIKEKGYNWDYPVQIEAYIVPIKLKNMGVICNGHHRLAIMKSCCPKEYFPIEIVASYGVFDSPWLKIERNM